MKLHHAPECLPPEYLRGCIPILIEFKAKELLVLCPVSKLNKLPEGLAYSSQGTAFFEDKSWDNSDILGPDGNLFAKNTPYHRLLAKALTTARVPLL